MAEMSDVAVRLKQYLKSVGMSVRQFEQKCDFANGWVGNIKEQIRLQALVTIGFHFPDLNLNWLFTGNGQMLNEGYRPKDLPTVAAPGYQDVPQGQRKVSEYDVHHNGTVNINAMEKEIAEMKAERKTLLAIIENLSKQ